MTDEEKQAARRKAEEATRWSKAEVLGDPVLAAVKLKNLGHAVLALLDEPPTPAEASAVQSVAEVEALKRENEALKAERTKTLETIAALVREERRYNDTAATEARAAGRDGPANAFSARVVTCDTILGDLEEMGAGTAEPVFTAAQVREAVEAVQDGRGRDAEERGAREVLRNLGL